MSYEHLESSANPSKMTTNEQIQKCFKENITKDYEFAYNYYNKQIEPYNEEYPIVIGPQKKQELLDTLSKIPGRLSRITPEMIFVALEKAGVYSVTDRDPLPEAISDEETSPASYNFVETPAYRAKLPGITAAQLTPEAAAALAANMSYHQRKAEHSWFFGTEHIDAMIAARPDWYTITDDEIKNLHKDFKGFYGSEEIDKDLRDTQDTLNRIQEDNQSNSTELENTKKVAILSEEGLTKAMQIYKWFGISQKLDLAHKFDDLRAKTDCVWQDNDLIKNTKNHIALDATFENITSERFEKKIRAILDAIQNDTSTEIKYYSTTINSKKTPQGKLSAPRLVLHLDSNDLKLLLRIADDAPKSAEQNEEYSRSSNGHTILRKLIEQTQVFIEVATHYNSPTILAQYQASLKTLIKAARNAKLELPKDGTKLEITKRIRDIANKYQAKNTNNSGDALHAIANLSFGK